MYKVLWGLWALVLSFQIASAGIIAKANTWQMMGYGTDVNLTATTIPSSEQFSLIWYYDNGDWKAFSKDASLLTTIHNLGIYGDKIKAGQAFWVKAKQDFSFIPHVQESDFLPTTQGWHLINLGSSFSASLLPANNSQMFVYRNGNWAYAYKNSEGTLVASKALLFANANEGFWIYNPTPLTNTFPRQNENYYRFTDTLSNKSFSLNSINLTFDQNGTVLSNDAKYNGGKWNGIAFDEWQAIFQIVKENKKYSLRFNRAYDSNYNMLDYLTLSSIGEVTFQTLSNGVIENLESNSTSYNGANVVMNITDYNRSKVLHVSVKNSLDTLKSIVDNGSANPRTQLSAIKTNLQALSNDNDAKVVLALVNLIEILDEDIVKNNFLINGSDQLNLNSLLTNLFPQDTGAMIDLASNISNYSTNARSMMQSLSTRLKSNADILKTIHDDENFYLPYDGKGINFADVKMLRGIMLGLAFKLQYISSYTLGTDEWFALQNESNIEFRKAEYDPVSFINSKTFFTSPDATKLTTAKALFREFVEVYYQLLNAEYYQREGMVIAGDKLSKRNLKRNLKLVLNNLDGISPKVVYINDWTDWGVYDPQTQTQTTTQKKENFAFDFNTLFNTSTAITINDFPSFAYEGVLHVSNSKIENSPVDANWMPLKLISATNFTNANNINLFFKYSIDQYGVTFSGANLLNEIFNH